MHAGTTLLTAAALLLASGTPAVAVAAPAADPPPTTVVVQAAAPATDAAQAAAQAAEAAADEATRPEFKWNWDNTLTYGLGFRLRDQDERIIGLAAGGKAYSVNGDDGNQNYEKGLFTNAAKITSEFEFSY
jgi:hypothetical protein